MENASKALLIAAAILIVIVLITLGIKVLGSVGNTAKQAQGVGDSLSSATMDSTSKVESVLSGLGGSSANLNHSGIIPEGGIYKLGYTNVKKEAGEHMPNKASTGDKYIFGDYEYSMKYAGGWQVDVIDKNKETYGSILESINGTPVANMIETFSNCTSLTIAPKIPDSVKEMSYTFFNCTSLIKAPKIPNNVTIISGIFSRCENLEKVINIPNKVTHISYAFQDCKKLKTVPKIPNSVKYMTYTFTRCELLSGRIEIDAEPNSYDKCFYGTIKDIIITGTTSKKNELARTSSKNNVKY